MGKKQDLNGHVPTPLVGAGSRVPSDNDAAQHWPNVVSCLMPHWREDKLCRQGGTLTFKPLGSYWSLTLRCPAEGLETSVALLTLIDALDSLEASLANGTAIWRPTYESLKKAGQRKG